MPSLWFVVPVHGRLPLAAICLRQLRRTCDALTGHGVEATAVVVADKDNLRELGRRLGTPRMLGFGTIERDNQFLSRRFNDAIQGACDPTFNPRPADFVVPCGSDDWIDWRILLNLPAPNQVVGFKNLSFVREDGAELTETFVDYAGGCGMRIYPRQVVARLGYRPADEDRVRACDTSILTNLRAAYPNLQIVHADTEARQIVDWKSPGQQINAYDDVVHKWRRSKQADPFVALAGVFPDESLRDMQAHYAKARRRALVAA